MKDKKKLLLLIATVILVIAAILCFTIFGKGGNSSIIKDNTDIANLHNMVPMVQRANSGLYVYGNISINDRTTEEIVIGALNHYEYVNCSNESTINNCDTLDVNKIISEVKEIYGLDITKEDIEKVETKDDKGIHFYVYGDGSAYQDYIYNDGVFTVEGEKGFVNKNNEIVKKEKKDNNYLLYEKVYYLGLDFKDNEFYEVLYENSEYAKEVAREKVTLEDNKKTGGIDISKYSDYGVTFIHTFTKDSSNYRYVSSTVEGFKVEEPPVEQEVNE